MPWPIRVAVPLLVLFAADPALAQGEDRRGFLGLGIGPSVPFGSFADASSIAEGSGRATPGYSSTFLNVGYRFRRRFGVAAALSYNQYILRDGGDDDWWEVAGAVIGPMYSHPLNARAAVDLKVMFGLIALTPVIDSYDTQHKTGGSRGVDVRAAVRYDVFTRWAVFAEAGLQTSSVSFDSGLQKDYGALISGLGIAFRPAW